MIMEETFENDFNRVYYSYPGYCVTCVITDNAFYGDSENVYQSLVEILYKLRDGIFENHQLQEDFQKYSEETFRCIPLEFREELADSDKRKDLLQDLLNEVGEG